MIALDASALIAFLFHEKGFEEVAAIVDDSCISTVNLAEVIGRFIRDGHEAATVMKRIAGTLIEIVPYGTADATLTASLLPTTKPFGLSLADRACLALALTRRIGAITADRPWLNVDLPIEIVCIR
jgi:ribonuclease VapC